MSIQTIVLPHTGDNYIPASDIAYETCARNAAPYEVCQPSRLDWSFLLSSASRNTMSSSPSFEHSNWTELNPAGYPFTVNDQTLA